MKRRHVSGACLLLLAACSSKTNETNKSDAGGDSGLVDTSPSWWNAPVTPPSDDAAVATRAACGYEAGALPLATQGASEPNGATIPIDTIVIIMMENRSFDHFYQDLPNVGITDVDVAPEDAGNPGIDGGWIPFHHDTEYCLADMDHEWIGTHQEVNGGLMNGFAVVNDGTHENPTLGPPDFLGGDRALTYYTHEDLPFMYWAAQNYAIGDRYFAAIQGPTWPNRMYLYAASSFGTTVNVIPPEPQTTLMTEMATRGTSWGIYADGTPGYAIFFDQEIKVSGTNIHEYPLLATAAAAGQLPHVVFVDPGLGSEAYNDDDDHPPAIPMIGEQWLAQTISTLTTSPQWAHMAIFIDFDENGGIFDHVPPRPACVPDNYAPNIVDSGTPVDASDLGAYDQTGVRVPFVVISPYAKQGYVGHQVYDHTSVTRFVESRFTLPAMTARDANALAPWDMFDFTSPPNLTVPTIPTVTVDPTILSTCQQTFQGIPSEYSQ